MKILIKRHRVLFTIVVLFVLLSTTYTIIAPPIFLSKSHVVIFRPKIENPDAGSDESRNRWIWIRDGLNMKSALVTDTMLKKFIISNQTIAGLSKKHPSEQSTIDYLKSLINIQFTGADENNYIVEVKAPNALMAYELNNLIFERIRYLAIDAEQLKFKAILDDLQKKQVEIKADPDTYAFYKDKIKKMIFNHIIEQKQRESSFEVLIKPSVNESPVLPNKKFIIIFSTFIGIVLGLFCEFMLSSYQQKNGLNK